MFCASLADVFDNQIDPVWRADLFNLIRECDQLDWQLLTKRPQNIRKMLPSDWREGYPNVWLGTTTEDAGAYKQRASFLLNVPAAIHFVSYEPAIGPLGQLDIDGRSPDWVIIGGESGVRSDLIRPTDPQWARDAIAECRRVGAAPFLKQWGTYKNNPSVVEDGLIEQQAIKIDPPDNGKGGGKLDGKLWREFPNNKLRTQPITVSRERAPRMPQRNPEQYTQGDDGLIVEKVGHWAIDKLKLVTDYVYASGGARKKYLGRALPTLIHFAGPAAH